MRDIITTHSLYYSESIIHVRYQDDDVTDTRKISDQVTLLDIHIIYSKKKFKKNGKQ